VPSVGQDHDLHPAPLSPGYPSTTTRRAVDRPSSACRHPCLRT